MRRQCEEKDARIAELEGAVAAKDSELEKRDARIAELERENEQLVAFRRDVVSTKHK